MTVIVGVGIGLDLALFFSVQQFFFGVTIGIDGNTLVFKCNEQLVTQKIVKYYKTYDLSDDGTTYKVGGKSYSDNEDNVTINSYTTHGKSRIILQK